MRATGKPEDMITRVVHARRLVKNLAFEDQHLISPQTLGARPSLACRERFGPRQRSRQVFCFAALFKKIALSAPLVEFANDDFEIKSRSFK